MPERRYPYHGYMKSLKALFSFPHPVNEHSARCVAGGVVIMCALILLTQQLWILIFLTYGFWARALTGPTLSPLGQFVTRVVVVQAKWKPKYVPGPPKRFAQSIGAALSTIATAFWLTGNSQGALICVALILVAATLESVFSFCVGCTIFGWLMKIGVIPQSVCEACTIPTKSSPR